MNFANAIKIERKKDHFVIHFFSESERSGADTEPVSSVVVPLLTGIDLALELFGGMIVSIADLNGALSALQGRITKMNIESAKLQAELTKKALEAAKAQIEAAKAQAEAKAPKDQT